jgi:hypothetical protein
MALTKTTYSMIDSTTVNVLDFVPAAEKALIKAGTPSVSVTAYIQAAHNSLPLLAGNYQGTLYFPAGKYRLDTGLNISATVLTTGYGAVLDYSDASSAVVAITCNSFSTGSQFDLTFGGIRGLTILGPGRATTGSKGIFYGDTSPSGTLICHEKSFQDLVISEFGKGIDQGSNAYNCKWYNCFIYRCDHGAYFGSGLVNNAEIVEFHGCVLAECVASNMSSIANAMDIAFFGGSIDYPLGSGAGGTGVNLNGDTIATFHGTHFEGTGSDIMVRNGGSVGSPSVNFYGCTFTISSGGTAPFIDADNIHCVLIGGWVRVAAGTQTYFLQSTGIYALLAQQLIVIGNITNKFYTGASVSGNKTIDNQIFTPKTIVAEYSAINMFGLGTNFGVYFRTAAGAPANSLAGIEQGSILLNQADTKLYINTGTSASTTWTVVGSQS